MGPSQTELESGKNSREFVFMSLSSMAGFSGDSFSLSNFTVSFDAVPDQNNADIVMGLSQFAAGTYAALATAIRFNPNGQIDVRNGGAYSAAASITYVANQSYHFEMAVDVVSHKYSVTVTPPGQAAVTLAQNYSFRNEQAAVTSLGNLGVYGNPGNVKVTKIAIVIKLPDISPNPTPTPTPTPMPAPSPAPAPVLAAPAPTSGDGAVNAPIGPAQKPNLFSGMKIRPPFKVAGVDYAVGIPAGTTLKSPASISMAGVSVNSSSRVVSVTGANVTLDSYDFSNWTVETSAANTRIIRSKFFVGPVVGLKGSSNLYVGYCVIDANNTQGSIWGD